MGKQVTHDEFMTEMKACHPNINVLSQYQKAVVPVRCQCKICGHEWLARPANLTHGGKNGCPRCSRNYHKTHEDFMKEIALINPNLEILSKYEHSHCKINVRCKIHDYIYVSTPTTLLSGEGCCYCGREASSRKRKMSTYERVKLKMRDVGLEYLTSFEEFCNDKQWSCKYLCNIHGVVEDDTYAAFTQRGNQCKHCFHEDSQAKKDSARIKKNRVNKSDMPGYVHPNRQTHEDFIKKLCRVNQDVELLSKYIKSSEKIKVRCKICSYEYMVKPKKLLSGRRCPSCAAHKKESTIAFELKKYAKECFSDVEWESKQCYNPKTNYPLPFDIYIGQHNIFCEINGKQHYEYSPLYYKSESDFEYRKHLDSIKRDFAKTHGNYLEIDLRKVKTVEQARRILNDFVTHLAA